MFVNENCHFTVSTHSSLINVSVTKHRKCMNRSLGKGLMFFSQRTKQNLQLQIGLYI